VLLAETSDTPDNVRSMDIDFGRPFPAGYAVKVTSGWEDGRGHPGLDISAKVGTPVIALQEGTIITARPEGTGDAGNWVGIQHAHGWVTRYMHLSKVQVKKGQVVKKGQQIGLSGNTGLSSGPHLHLDLKLLPEWIPLVEREVGRPKTGYFTKQDGRTGVPAEPWVPVDSYRDDVIERARRNNIPLYAERKKRQHETEASRARVLGPWTKAAITLGILGAGAGVMFYVASVTAAAPGRRRIRWGT
jgi:murein DD-endopeptidase MepM/ murein hydrolase activator NlpD